MEIPRGLKARPAPAQLRQVETSCRCTDSTLPAIVESTGCLALVQRRLADRFSKSHGIEIHNAPFEVAPVDIRAYWSRTADRDPAHSWFRELLAGVSRLA